MSLTVKAGDGGDYEQIPEGLYVARCFKIIDLGTQDTEWQGETKSRAKVLITWEILDEETRMSDGQPFVISKRYTASLDERSQLRKDLESWRGQRFTQEELEGFDLKKVLGAYCQMQVLHSEKNGRTYENVDTIMLSKVKPKGVNKEVSFDIENPDDAVFETFSDKLKETIAGSPEWQAHKNPAPATAPKKAVTASDDYQDDEPVNLSEIPF